MALEMIEVTNGYLESVLNNPMVKKIISKPFTAKTSYWIARVLDEIKIKGKIYILEKQKLIEKYAKRYPKSKEIVKEGDSIILENPEAFTNEINELTEIKISLGIPKIEYDFDKEPACTVEEMTILLPLITPKE